MKPVVFPLSMLLPLQIRGQVVLPEEEIECHPKSRSTSSKSR